MEKNQSRVMKMAHIMHKDKPRFPWSETLRRAWWFIGFRNRLSHGFATFSFWKKDGSIREAKGTLFMPLIPVEKHPKGDVGVRCTVYGVQNFTYFDLDKQEWRSFDIRNFIGFITYYRITGDK